jgi:SecD/SecF fusion protein
MKEIFVQPVGTNRILVQLPGLKKSEVENIINTLMTQGKLEFKIVVENEELIAQAEEYLQAGKTLPLANFPYEMIYKQFKDEYGIWKNIPGSGRLVEANARVTGSDLKSATKYIDPQSFGSYAISIAFNAQGSNKFADLTEANVGKNLAIILDGKLQSDPNLREPIFGGQCQITGSFSEDEAETLVAVLRSGSMDVKPELLTQNIVGPTLGSDSISSGITACMIGGLLVLAFMVFYYKSLGLIANIALLINLLLLMGSIAFFGGTLTLPGIAGFALTIGMAVDATVLIFERLREESYKNQPIKASLAQGYQRAFVTIFDSNLTTFITALILYYVGNSGPVKGFCLSLMLGLSINLFAAVFVTQTLISLAVYKNKFKSFVMNKPLISNTSINFIALSKKVIFVSYFILGLGLILVVVKGKNMLDVDFTGGNLLQINLTEKTSADQIRSIVEGQGISSPVVQSFGGGQGKSYTIRTPHLEMQEKMVLQESLLKNLPTFEDTSLAFPRDITVGGIAADRMLAFAVVALIAAMLAILIYIMVRFTEFKYGIAACVALIHDVGITIGVLAILGVQINLTIFAAILTVVGYSLNDTIVIFDRIRENVGIQKNPDLKTIAIRSLNQTLNRTLLTSITTFCVVGSLLFLGGGVIQGFALTMLIGLITGTYSSLFIATPFVIFLHNKDKHAQMEKDSDVIPTESIKPNPHGTV